jgi:S-methylmethionine-dependent homocysteine/selenocysteine methylase
MKKHTTLPQLDGGWFLTDGGLETVLIYDDGLTLPEFASFVLLDSAAGRATLERYYRRYLDIAAGAPGAGFVLESPTWRASPEWGAKIGYDTAAIERVNRDAVALMHALRAQYQPRIAAPIVVSGCIGPRGDGYIAGQPMHGDDAMRYHLPQARALCEAGPDMLSAITMTTSGEAIGVARAAAAVGLPCAVSFTVETDARLPSGEGLGEAIERCDRETRDGPAYYMVNCAHPTHFESALARGGAWTGRIRGLRANASTKSHAELDAMTSLDSGDPADLGERYRRLRAPLPRLSVLGGCCGTDHRHVAAMCAAWQEAYA